MSLAGSPSGSSTNSPTGHCEFGPVRLACMSRTTVLVGFAEALAAPEVVWSLVDQGFHVVAFARKGRASAIRHSHHVVVHEISAPESGLDAALSDLRALSASLSSKADGGAPCILFPLDDTAVWLSSKVRLDQGWLSAGPQGACAELALNKSVQTRMALEAGFNVPKTLVAQTAREIFEFCDAQSFPVILKPAQCVPTREDRIDRCRKWICANRSGLERAVAEWAERIPLLVQPFIVGTGEGIFGLAAPDGVRAWSAHRRLRMMNPHGSGSSACVSQSVPRDLRETVETLVRAAKWRGLFMIELLRDAAGKPWFVEINGRPWGSMALSRHQGLEYPAWHVMLALDEHSPAGRAVSSAAGLVCRHVGREIMNLLFVLRGPKSKALTNWPSLPKTLREVLRIHRGDVYYNWRRDDARVFLADCYYTIYGNLFKSSN